MSDLPTDEEIDDVVTGENPRGAIIMQDALWRAWHSLDSEQKRIFIAQAIMHDEVVQNVPF